MQTPALIALCADYLLRSVPLVAVQQPAAASSPAAVAAGTFAAAATAILCCWRLSQNRQKAVIADSARFGVQAFPMRQAVPAGTLQLA